MDLASKFTLSASMLLTGFAIVFAVLFFLIFVIWGYGKIVTAGLNASEKRKAKKKAADEAKIQQESKAEVVKPVTAVKPVANGLSDEVVAVISAAVYSMYGSTDKVKIKSIKKASGRSAWANAGVLNNTRPF
ncbi:MAG: OadG family protein [Ruminococcus sp.]